MTRVAGRVAVVTGAGSGIGRALAVALARAGARLALSDVAYAAVEDTAARCRDLGTDARAYRLDVTDAAAVSRHADGVAATFGAVHLVCNNAGVAHTAVATAQSLADIERVLAVNLWGVVHGSQAFLPHLLASGDGHLVNVSSLFGLLAMPGHSAYNASKFAVRGYTETLAAELRAVGAPVRVSCVHPGGVATAIARTATLAADLDRQELVRRFDQMARTSPERAARAILRGVVRNRVRIHVGPDAHALGLAVRLLGGAYVRPLGWLAGRLLRDQLPPVSRSGGTPAAATRDAPAASSVASSAGASGDGSGSRSQATTTSSTKAM
jgi:NAD(P)-dependent dehydrogenase (short-subunit alcohol dehydrogenase family)